MNCIFHKPFRSVTELVDVYITSIQQDCFPGNRQYNSDKFLSLNFNICMSRSDFKEYATLIATPPYMILLFDLLVQSWTTKGQLEPTEDSVIRASLIPPQGHKGFGENILISLKSWGVPKLFLPHLHFFALNLGKSIFSMEAYIYSS